MSPPDRTSRPMISPGRPLVVAAAAAWGALVVIALGLRQTGWPWAVAAAIFFACWAAAKSRSRHIADRPRDDVDEYESLQRDRARGVGYTLVLTGGVVLVLVLVIAVQLAERGHTSLLHQAPALTATMLLPGVAAPTFWIAWSLRADHDDLN